MVRRVCTIKKRDYPAEFGQIKATFVKKDGITCLIAEFQPSCLLVAMKQMFDFLIIPLGQER